MPLLGVFLSSVFGSLFTFLATYFTRKTAVILTLISIFTTLTVAFFFTMKLLFLGVTSTIPNAQVVQFFFALWPSNAETCFTALFGAEVAAFLYRYQLQVVRTIVMA